MAALKISPLVTLLSREDRRAVTLYRSGSRRGTTAKMSEKTRFVIILYHRADEPYTHLYVNI